MRGSFLVALAVLSVARYSKRLIKLYRGKVDWSLYDQIE